MQNFNSIAQSVLKLSHREKGLQRRQRQQRRRRRHPSGLNYSPRRKVFRRGQKSFYDKTIFMTIFFYIWYSFIPLVYCKVWFSIFYYDQKYLRYCAIDAAVISFLDSHLGKLSDRFRKIIFFYLFRCVLASL